MKYQFKLEAVRKLREFEEEKRQRELADAQRILEEERAVLDKLIVSRSQTEASFRQKAEQGDIASQAAMYRAYLQRLSKLVEEQEHKIETASQVCEEKREALLEAMQKRKALDRLKEKGEQAFIAQLNSDEEKFINEIAINRFTLKQR